MVKSDITGRLYQPVNCCYIQNPKQTALYMKNGVALLDIIVGNGDKLVYVFDKSSSAQLYEKWKNYELN